MRMQKTAKIKKIGERAWKDVVMNLPDFVTCLDPYNIEIVEYPHISTGMIFIVEKEADIYNLKYDLNDPGGIKECMRALTQQLTTTTSLVTTTDTPCVSGSYTIQ